MIALPFQGQPIALLRTQTVVSPAGAQNIALPPQGSVVYPRSTGDPVMTWLAPNQPIPDSVVQTGAVTLTPREGRRPGQAPKRADSLPQGVAEAVVREALLAKLARTLISPPWRAVEARACRWA